VAEDISLSSDYGQQKEGRRTGITELETLFWVALSGLLVGVLFDFYRSLRRGLHLGPRFTALGDILFSVVALLILFYLFNKANFLALRAYLFWGSLLGLFIYLRFFSRLTRSLFHYLFSVAEKAAGLIRLALEIPWGLIVIIMRPPYAVLRWLSLLLYRIGQALVPALAHQSKNRIHKAWSHRFPPRIKD